VQSRLSIKDITGFGRCTLRSYFIPPSPPNYVLHTDSAPTLGFQFGDHMRGAGEGERQTAQRTP
jgi:hypothetical protein